MNSVPAENLQEVCEEFLHERKRYNSEHNILPSESGVADRLLNRRVEMRHVYEELHGKLRKRTQAIHVFLDLVLSAATYWSPEKNQQARAARDRLANTNRQIATKAGELAVLLEQRSELHNSSDFSSKTHNHVCDVIELACQHNFRFRSYVQDRLSELKGQFDLKYWPSLSEFVQVLASDAEHASIVASDPLTAAATEASRQSRADFFKALLAAIDENRAENHGQLPMGFKLTDRALASLGNCALNLDPDNSVDADYIKRFRQRERIGAEYKSSTKQ